MDIRVSMETAIKTKINVMLERVESDKMHEEELIDKITTNRQERIAVEKKLTLLHKNLSELEGVLKDKEYDNQVLIKTDLIGKELDLAIYEEAISREEHESFHTNKNEYSDIIIESKRLDCANEELNKSIWEMEKRLLEEEQKCNEEEHWIAMLEQQLENLEKRLNEMCESENELTLKSMEQGKKLNEVKQKHRETDKQAVLLEIESKKLEAMLEMLTLKFGSFDKHYQDIVKRLEQQNSLQKAEDEVEQTTKHKLMRLKN